MRLAALFAAFLIAMAGLVAWPERLGPRGLGITEWRGSMSEITLTSIARTLLSFEQRWEKALGLRASIEIDIPLPDPAPPVAILPEPRQDVPIEQVCEKLAEAAAESELPLGFFARLIWFESSFRQRLVSRAGAQGMAQFMPKVAEERGLEDPFDPLAALPASARFLREHYRYFGNWGLAAAAYNAGARRVEEWIAQRGPMPDETRNYVRNITGHEPEKWLEQKPVEIAVHLPKLAPCEGVGGLSRQVEARTVPAFVTAVVVKAIDEAKAAAERIRIARAAAAKARLARIAKARQVAGAENKPESKVAAASPAQTEAKPAAKPAVTAAASAPTAPARPASKTEAARASMAAGTATAASAVAAKPAAAKPAVTKPAVTKPAVTKSAIATTTAKPAPKPAAAGKPAKPVKLAEAKR
ncbi:MAG: transglycosylase SLT domain-containing protein [Pseudorhodoplanes sp.]